MAKSTQIVTDLATVRSNGPSQLTQANANAPAGVIMDFNGNVELLQVKAAEFQRMLVELLKDVDTTQPDPNLAILQGLQQVFV